MFFFFLFSLFVVADVVDCCCCRCVDTDMQTHMRGISCAQDESSIFEEWLCVYYIKNKCIWINVNIIHNRNAILFSAWTKLDIFWKLFLNHFVVKYSWVKCIYPLSNFIVYGTFHLKLKFFNVLPILDCYLCSVWILKL